MEDRTHREAGAEENGIHPTTTPRDGEFQTRPFDSSTSQQRTKEKEKEEEEEREERGDVKPFEEEAPSIREEASDRERPRENGIEEVSQQTSAETVSALIRVGIHTGGLWVGVGLVFVSLETSLGQDTEERTCFLVFVD